MLTGVMLIFRFSYNYRKQQIFSKERYGYAFLANNFIYELKFILYAVCVLFVVFFKGKILDGGDRVYIFSITFMSKPVIS